MIKIKHPDSRDLETELRGLGYLKGSLTEDEYTRICEAPAQWLDRVLHEAYSAMTDKVEEVLRDRELKPVLIEGEMYHHIEYSYFVKMSDIDDNNDWDKDKEVCLNY